MQLEVIVIIAGFFNFQLTLTEYDELILERFVDHNVGEQTFTFAISGELDTSYLIEEKFRTIAR